MTRCIRKRLPLQQTTPAPDPGPTATALRSPYCIASVSGTPPTHTVATHRRPNPVHSRVSTRDSVTFLRQPCPGHDPHTPHTRPACAPSLRDFSPLSSLQSPQFRQPCLPLSCGATLVSKNSAQALQIRPRPAAPSATRRTQCRRIEQISASRVSCPRGSRKRDQPYAPQSRSGASEGGWLFASLRLLCYTCAVFGNTTLAPHGRSEPWPQRSTSFQTEA